VKGIVCYSKLIVKGEKMVEYFTGDQHYDSEGIIKYCQRPFDNRTHMVSEMIHRHNRVVKPEDTVYHIGDFFFEAPTDLSFMSSILNSLNGTHILILGNHDGTDSFKLVNVGFRSVHTSLELKINGYDVVLVHDPSAWTVIPPKSRIVFLCGHIHKLFQSIPHYNVVNVGVDVWDYYPISFSTVLDALKSNDVPMKTWTTPPKG
jgi:calcineurin-like phosphoesterase family protein